MSLHRHLLLLSLCVGVVTLPRIVFRYHYRDELRKVASHAAAMRSEELEATWKNTTFSDLDSPGVENSSLDKIQWPALNLPETQQALLRTRLPQVLRYLKAPGFDDYFRLKTEGFHYRFAPDAWTSNLLSAASWRLLSSDPTQFEPRLREMWTRVTTGDGKVLHPGLGALSLETVSAAISHTNSSRALLAGPVKKGFTVAAEFSDPGFQYLKGEGPDANPLVFELSFIAKARLSHAAGPVHISLLWIEKDQNWALNRLILDTWLGFNTLF